MGFDHVSNQIRTNAGTGTSIWSLDKYSLGKPRPDDVDFAQAKVGAPLPLVYGTVRVSPVLYWWGNQQSATTTDGYVYRADFLLGAGISPWDQDGPPWQRWRWAYPPKLKRLYYGDIPNLGVLNVEHGGFANFAMQLAGGINDSISGKLEFFDGREDQSIAASTIRAAMASASGVNAAHIPDYQHQILVGLTADSIGLEAKVQSLGLEVQVLGPQPIGDDANPAWVLYDLLCGKVWKLGYDTAKVDLASFEAAATTLVDEEHGCSIAIYEADDATRIMQSILAQIDATLFEDPSTGTIKLKLIRADYDPNTIPVMTVDNTLDRFPEITFTSWEDTKNKIQVSFTDRSRSYKPNTVLDDRLANARSAGEQIRETQFEVLGCMTAALAKKIGARELSIAGRPLMTGRVRLNRTFYTVLPGGVLKAQWPHVGITGVVFRVLEVDFGQIADSAITVTLVEDVFDQTLGGFGDDPGVVATVDALPILNRIFDEAPLWLTRLAWSQGHISDATTPRVLGVGRKEPEQAASAAFAVQTRTIAAPDYANDVVAQTFPTTAKVVTAYPYHLSPYDTATGLIIEDVTGELADTFTTDVAELAATAGQVAGGANMIRINGEMMAFESVTNLGSGQYRLNNVWRGLFDTAPDDHAADDVVYWLDFDNVGVRGWSRGQLMDGQAIAVPFSPGDFAPTDVQTLAGNVFTGEVGRAERALLAADLCVNSVEYASGTLGIPATPTYKKLSMFEGSLEATWRQRNEDAVTIVRGDDATAYSVQDGALWRFFARKGDQTEQLVQGPLTITSVDTVGILVGAAGHGELDLLLRTDGEWGTSWQDARCRVSAHRARNLLGNATAGYVALAPWTNQTGTTAIQQGTNSLERTASGRWFQAATASSNLTVLEQVVDVSGYKPRGLRARVVWYTRNFSGDVNDHSAIELISGATSSTSSTVVGSTTGWKRAEHSITIPAGATTVTVRVRMTGVSNAVSLAGVAGLILQVEHASNELLSNGQFDSALATGWTTAAGVFTNDTTMDYASNNGTLRCVRPGATAGVSEIKQDISVPAGYEYGTAELRFARATGTLVGSGPDTGEVVLEVLNGASTVIATTTTDYEAPETWSRRILRVDLPDGAATIRVRLRGYGDFLSPAEGGTYGDGAARFDDLSLRIHKHLDSVFERDLGFGVPQRQAMPRLFGEAYVAWRELAIPMVWNGSSLLPSAHPAVHNAAATAAWSDASTPTPAKFVGHWTVDEVAALSVDAYRFARATAGSAVDVQIDGYGDFAKADSFSIAVCFRTTELAMTLACGLVGRRAADGKGWGLSLDSSGRIVGAVQGTSGRTATGTIDHRDGAAHWVLMTWNGTTLSVSDAAGAATNALDPGEFSQADIPMRIGRDGPASATGGVDVARVLVWDGAVISHADFLSTIHRIGTDPNNKIDRNTGWTSTQPVWVDGGSDADGATLIRCATRHVPITYRAELDATGDGYGLSTGTAIANLVRSTNYPGGANCGPEAGAAVTQSIVDPTGLPRGVRVTNSVISAGYRLTDMPIGAVAGTAYVVLWLRSPSGSENVTIKLLDSDENTSGTTVVAVSMTWQRVALSLTWTGATPTAHIKVSCDDDTISFDLGSVAWCSLAVAPTAYLDAALSTTSRHGVISETMPLQIHREGEIEVDVFANVDPTASTTLASIDNATADLKNQRAMSIIPAGTPFGAVWDNFGSPVGNTVTAGGTSWSTPRSLRLRWNQLQLPEALTNQIAIAEDDVVEDDVVSAFTVSTSVASEKIRLGGGNLIGTVSPHAALRRVVIRAREEKLS